MSCGRGFMALSSEATSVFTESGTCPPLFHSWPLTQPDEPFMLLIWDSESGSSGCCRFLFAHATPALLLLNFLPPVMPFREVGLSFCHAARSASCCFMASFHLAWSSAYFRASPGFRTAESAQIFRASSRSASSRYLCL